MYVCMYDDAICKIDNLGWTESDLRIKFRIKSEWLDYFSFESQKKCALTLAFYYYA